MNALISSLKLDVAGLKRACKLWVSFRSHSYMCLKYLHFARHLA
jgi:hypothetical protein